MSKEKPKTPYERLVEETLRFLSRVLFPKKKEMWTYTKQDVDSARYAVGDVLRQRVIAARQLGYEVHIVENDGVISVLYVEKRPEWDDLPWSLRK